MGDREENEGILGKVRMRFLGFSKKLMRTAAALGVGGALGFGVLSWLSTPGATPAYLALPGLLSIGAFLVAPLVALVGKVIAFGSRRHEGRVRRDDSGWVLVRPDGREFRIGTKVESGVIAPGEGSFDVQLVLEDGNVASVQVDDEESAEALLELVGVGSERRRTRVTWARWPARVAAGSLGAFVGLVAAFAGFLAVAHADPIGKIAFLLVFVVPFLLVGPFSRLFAWRELEVGADAVAWRYWLRKKFVPLARLRAVDVRDGQLILRLEDGTDRRFEIPTPGVADGLRRRIDKALAAMGAADRKGEFFARGELTFAEWVGRMRGLLNTVGAFREAPVGVEDVMRVLEDPDAEPDVRLGAAMALHGTDDDELKQRVRVVAQNCVSPKLRVALEEAAEGRELEEAVVEAARDELRVRRLG